MSKKRNLAKKILEKNNLDTNNPGGIAEQITIISEKISNLMEHLKNNRKDLHSTRGLLKNISKRRKLIKYLKRKDLKKWEEIAEKIGLKK